MAASMARRLHPLRRLLTSAASIPHRRLAFVRCLCDSPSPVELEYPSFATEKPSSLVSLIQRSNTNMAPLFPGCDYHHWLIVMDKPGGEGASKEQIIDCYVQTLANVLGSEEEAKKKIYSVSWRKYFGFGCDVDEETSDKLEDLPGVLFALPDSYVDPEHKDYGGELFVNGEIVQRPPERQRRVERQSQGQQDRPRYNNRTRNVQRREKTR